METFLPVILITMSFFTLGSMELELPAAFNYFFNPYTTDVQSLSEINITDVSCAQCPQVYLPVCATNNKTFTNECFISCLNFRKSKGTEKWEPIRKFRMGPCDVFGAHGGMF